MDRWLIALSFCWILGCSTTPSLNPQFDEIHYDFQEKSVYPVSDKHQSIYIHLDAKDLSLPDENHRMPSLLLDWGRKKSKADFILFIRFSNSFLVERISGIRTEVEFDEDGRGEAFEIPIQRGFIRTHYTIELVDVLNDSLVNQYQGAGNYGIEAKLVRDIAENRQLLQAAFQDELGVARYQLMTEIWKKIKKFYLNDLMVTFGKQKYRLVSELDEEPAFLTAFDLLSENNKSAANKALTVYNNAIKQYPSGESEKLDKIRQWLDQGITAASAIANHEFDDRYPPED